MKYVAFAAEKGGAGKTTQSFNFGEWLAAQGKKVLLIDMDQQASLSEVYGLFTNSGTSVNMFRNDDVEIHHIKENVDVIPASYSLDLVETETISKPMRELTLAFWFQDHEEQYNWARYDYIILDTHPDFKVITQNVVAMSDVVISPLEPNLFGYSAKAKLTARLDLFRSELINPATRESLVNTQLYFIDNKVAHNTIESHELLKKTKEDESVIAVIPEKKALFPKSIRQNYPVSSMMQDTNLISQHREFFAKLNEAYEQIKDVIDQTN
ncbi:MAG: ParA family protein [Lactobacillaceae bacterium]|nr:ParA family protein [Lactobacillaceae bacterium]